MNRILHLPLREAIRELLGLIARLFRAWKDHQHAVKDAVRFTGQTSRTDLAELRDAFTGAVLNPSLVIFQCVKCRVHYQEDSYRDLQVKNAGRCVACSGTQIERIQRPSIVFRPIMVECRSTNVHQ